MLLYAAGLFWVLLFLGVVTEVILRIAGKWPAALKEGFAKMYFIGSGIAVVTGLVVLMYRMRKELLNVQLVVSVGTGVAIATMVVLFTRPVKR